MDQLKCAKCGRRLADIDIEKGTIEIKCPRCKATTRLTLPLANKPAEKP